MKERNPKGNDTSPDRMRMPEIFLASNVLKKKNYTQQDNTTL